MGTLATVALQIALTVFVTASVMPVLVMALPALRASPRLGLGLAVGIAVACFGAIATLWPSRRN